MYISVTNLDINLTDKDLLTLFAPFGEVKSAVIAMDAFTDQSRGFGYVEMPSEEEAHAAVSALHQKELSGQVISVQEREP